MLEILKESTEFIQRFGLHGLLKSARTTASRYREPRYGWRW